MRVDVRRSNLTHSLALILLISACLALAMRFRLQVPRIESDLGLLALGTFLPSVARECPFDD